MSVSEPAVYVLHHAAPIPIGHRVELHFYARDTGLFSHDFREQPDMPVIRDLETGIEYAPEWLFERGATSQLGQVSARALELSPLVRPTRTITGRVVACRVVTGMSGADWTVFTYLTLREDDRRIYR